LTERGPRATTNGHPGEEAALESVRRLEASLESRRNQQEAAEARRAAAHSQARDIVARALEEARREAREHEARVLLEADTEAERILGEARAEVGTFRALAEGDRPQAVREVLRCISPGSPGGGA